MPTTSSWSAPRLDQVLANSRTHKRASLGLYLPVGYPTLSTSLDALHLMGQAADILEIGIPHVQPFLDGPVIQRAVAEALDNGFKMRDVFTATAELTASTSAALAVMSYWTPIEQYPHGPRAFAHDLAAAGAAALLVPDLPAAAAIDWHEATRAAGLQTITLIPPHASDAHVAAIGTTTTGMVYAPATSGLTGGGSPLAPHLPRLVHRLRTATRLPVAVGIGINTPAQAEHVSGFADAVVVGSALIRRMQALPKAPVIAAAATARDFADAVQRAHQTAA